MDVLIIDDEQLARDRLVRMIERLPDHRLCGVAADAQSGLTLIEQQDPDIVLCDIRMPGQDGLQLAAQLQQLDDPPALIFCTAYDHYALEAFSVQAAGYLLKPVSDDDLTKALARASRPNRMQRLNLQTRAEKPISKGHLQANSQRGITLIPLSEVYFCRAEQKYVTVHHHGGETLIDDTLKQLEEAHPGVFLRVHRNTLVQIDRITQLQRHNDGTFSLKLGDCDEAILVSRRHVAPVKAFLATL